MAKAKKTAVITGSARGLGFEMAKVFQKNGWNVVLSDFNVENLEKAEATLKAEKSKAGVLAVPANVTLPEDLENLWKEAVAAFGAVDVWINNAGVNQPMVPVWELTKEQMDIVIDIDLKGAMYGCKTAINGMNKQGFGAVYCIEGFGSDDATQLGLTAYGSSKRGVKYLVAGLAKELELTESPVKIGRLNPGIMITDFITKPLGQDGSMELSEKTKKVYNILGDYPDVVANFLVKGMVKNDKAKKNDVYIAWLTSKKAAWRFMTAGFNKRDFFAEEK